MNAQVKVTQDYTATAVNVMPCFSLVTEPVIDSQTVQHKIHAASQFSKAATTYSQHANVQKHAADDLVNLIKAHQHTEPATTSQLCVDLGAGPLVNTATLKHLFSNVLAIDLSLAMLKSSHSDIPRVCADMDKLPLQGASIDVLYSNFAVQWSDDFAALLSSLYKVIKPGGQAYISCVTQGSLNEIKTAFSALDAHNHINSFNSEEYINHSVEKAGFRINRADKKVYIDEYDTPLAAIKSIKAIGATAKNNPDMRRGLLTKQALQRVCNAYPLKRNKAQVSYHVVLLALTKSV